MRTITCSKAPATIFLGGKGLHHWGIRLMPLVDIGEDEGGKGPLKMSEIIPELVVSSYSV